MGAARRWLRDVFQYFKRLGLIFCGMSLFCKQNQGKLKMLLLVFRGITDTRQMQQPAGNKPKVAFTLGTMLAGGQTTDGNLFAHVLMAGTSNRTPHWPN